MFTTLSPWLIRSELAAAVPAAVATTATSMQVPAGDAAVEQARDALRLAWERLHQGKWDRVAYGWRQAGTWLLTPRKKPPQSDHSLITAPFGGPFFTNYE